MRLELFSQKFYVVAFRGTGFFAVVVVSVVVDATQHNSFRPGAEVQVVVRMRHVMTPCDIKYTLQTTRRSGYLIFPFSSAAAWPS